MAGVLPSLSIGILLLTAYGMGAVAVPSMCLYKPFAFIMFCNLGW